ncbi:L-proline trans-4-hydroxylase-like [Watersipora subatra]|uniref:L-proline trans-4-hydroxylase-like n=1 Tax=Watersipora subatra TaxID=2589382 RepID=UPI00355C8196
MCEVIIEDGTGQTKSRLVIWNQPGNDVSGIVARSEKLVRTTEKLLGGEVFHYHTKLIPKQPRTGGVFQWHQDYGYWYNNGNLTPDINTVYIAVDRCDTDNGCIEASPPFLCSSLGRLSRLIGDRAFFYDRKARFGNVGDREVMPGSHRCGRINHAPVGGQQGADLDRVELLKKRFPIIPVVLDPGDTLIFHSNIVHKSNANASERRRWALLVSYNTKENESSVKHHHSQYVPLDVVPDSAILECTNFEDISGKDFIDPEGDKTVGKPKYISEEEQKNM